MMMTKASRRTIVDSVDDIGLPLQNCKKAPDVAFSKAQLETISTTMRRAIRAWGIAEAPRTITSMSARFISLITGWR